MSTNGGTFAFGPYRLKGGPNRLLRGTEEIALRPKSLKVLVYLARHSGRLVTKEELREQVWGAISVSDSRLRVTLSEVRKALGDDQENPAYLETLPGRGYRFMVTNEATELDDALLTLGGPRPVVGRERELEHLVNRFLEANSGERRLIFLGGEPGVGKTTLVNLFLERLAGRPNTSGVRGQCVMHYGASEAYAPVLEAIERMSHEGLGHAVVRVLEHCAPMWLMQLPTLVESEEVERLQRQVQGATHDRMVRELNNALEQLTENHTLVLVLEDLHWSDAATLDLLTSIAQRPEPARLLIVGTYRPAEAIVHAPALSAIMRELEGRGLCERHHLELLTSRDVSAYVKARIGSERTEDVAATVYELSDGNALFMVNLLEHLIEARAIRRLEGNWVVDGASVALTEIPKGLRPFLERLFDTLSVEDRELLEAASVVGVEFAAAAVYAGLPHSDGEQDLERVEMSLDSLLKRTQLIVPCGTTKWPDGTLTASYQFGHALYREALYMRIAEARRERLHRRMGERLRKAWGDDSRAISAVLADHFERGNDPENAAWYRQIAGSEALRRFAYHEATQHFQAALKSHDEAKTLLADGDHRDPFRWELEVCTALGTALSVTRGYSDPDVAKINSRARSLINRIDDPSILVPILFNLWLRSGAAADFAENTNVVKRMSKLAAGTEKDDLAIIHSSAKSRTQFYIGDLAGSAEHMRRMFTCYDSQALAHVHDRYGVVEHAVGCLGVNGWLLWLRGYPDKAFAWIQKTDELAERLDGPYYDAVAGYSALPTLQLCGDTARLERRTSDLERLSTKQGYALWLGWATCFEGWLAGERGNLDEGIALMERGVEAWLGTGSRFHLPYLLALLAELHLRAGRIEKAGERLAKALAQVESSGERYWQAEIHRLQGEVLLAAAAGDGDRAEVCFRRALEVAGRQGASSLELRAALSLSRLGNSPDAHQLLGEAVGRFTEGHDTADLRAARAQLSLIRSSNDD